ncbi:MAG TPA: ethylbenzene dehydrogenase-related protein [Phycisphaerae bacterium]|nr:ethylbenzene dehydrogenase-related protein [Phycisphaerae bacterium]
MNRPAVEPGAGQPTLPTGMRLGVIAAVCAVNLMILAYAVSRAVPHESRPAAQAPPPAIAAVPAAQPVASRPSVAAVVNPIVLPAAAVVTGAYVQHCSACHGTSGHGDGAAAAQLYPRPRDFVASPFRFTSSSGRREEIIAGLERTISLGVPRSAMPGFGGVLDEPMIAGLARYVLDQRSSAPTPPSALDVDVGTRPPTTPGFVARGAELFNSQGCITCHGPAGHGDGEQSRKLVDSIGRPVRPADLASGMFKSGQGPADLCRSILKGVPGTPMIAYEPALTRTNPDGTRDLTDAWALVAFIQSFSPKDQPIGHTSGAELVAIPASDEAMLHEPAHPAWLGVSPTSIELRPLWQRVETITHVDVRMVRSSTEMAICLDWRDGTLDASREVGVFSDAVAVMFALGDDVPALPMGVHVEGFQAQAPVNLWHWKANRQWTAVADPAAEHGPPEKGWSVFGAPKAVVAAQPDDNSGFPSFYTARDVGNVHEDELLLPRAALEANAEGFGTLTLQPPETQGVSATAIWSNGLWRVVMVRAIESSDELDIDLTRHRRIPITFAVWDGSKGDRDGIKLISGWHWLVPASASSTSHVNRGQP